MKGKISPTLEKILQNPESRIQLRRALTAPGSPTVQLDGKSYTVRRIEPKSIPSDKLRQPSGNR